MNLTKQLNPNCVIRIFKSNLHLTQQVAAGKLWRQKNSLPKLQTARGPLIDLPDFSFLDGRPTPLSVGQVRRRELQSKLAKDALDGLNFISRSKELLKNIKKDSQ